MKDGLDINPDRWPDVSRVFAAAAPLDGPSRNVYLDDACRHDAALRVAVESLLAAHDHAGSFGEAPVVAPLGTVKRLAPESHLGPFRIESLLGAGGMGEVYRAHDTKLHRAVAIKVLPDFFAQDPNRLARFEEEARALAALNHPHVGAIYGVEERAGIVALVLELVEGPTLAERLAVGPLAFDEVVWIARQLAEGLEAAHERGIVHRDLKPANIKITPDGNVKILDFGLAKTAGSSAGTAMASAVAVHRDATQEGTVLGTVGYMSPEQARGQAVDKRTDIWAFGCVLFEMCAHQPPFAGVTISDAQAAVIDREPDWTLLRSGTPANLVRLLRRCLTKDPKLRLRDIGEARIALSPDSAGEDLAVRPGNRRVAAMAAILGVMVLASVVAVAVYGPPSWGPSVSPPPEGTPAANPAMLTRLTFDDGLQAEPTWSPDGRFIAFSSNQSGNFEIWVQPVAGGRAIQVTFDPAADWQPDWSPDGNSIAFRSERDNGGIFVVPALGGRERRLTTFGTRPQWAPSGAELMFIVRSPLRSVEGGLVYLVGLDGAPPRRILEDVIAAFGGPFGGISQFEWHPDRRRISFHGHQGLGGEHGFFTVPIAGGPPIRLEMSDAFTQFNKNGEFDHAIHRWAPSGDALYLETSVAGTRNLWRVGVDPQTLRWISAPEHLTTGSGIDQMSAPSPDGTTLAFVTTTETTRLWSVPFDARARRVTGEGTPITGAGMSVESFDLSANGQRIAYAARRVGKPELELWTRALDQPAATMLVEGAVLTPRVSRDGSRISYRLTRQPNPLVQSVLLIAAGGGAEQELPKGVSLATDWSPSGDDMLHNCPTMLATICSSPAGASTPAQIRTIVKDPDHAVWQGRYSPDGRWVLFNAFKLKSLSESVLGIVPASGGPWTRLTSETLWADKARWAPDGRTIYFISNRGGPFFDVWGVRFDPATGKTIGEEFRVTRYDSPSRLLVATNDSELGVSESRLVVPIVETTGSIWLLKGVAR